MINNWYIAFESKKLKNKPIDCKILDTPLVIFRNKNEISALLNRCPHRNVHLSKGKIKNGNLQCPYHGWEFNTSGECVKIPSLCDNQKIPLNANVQKFNVIEQDNYIWVWVGNREPFHNEKPIKITEVSNGWGIKMFSSIIYNNMENTIENFVDTTHTGFIHGGIFRGEPDHVANNFIEVVDDGVIIDIEEEEKSKSLLANLLVGNNKQIHQDRFIAPSTVKVSYSFGEEKQMITYHIFTPVDKNTTLVYISFIYKFSWLNPLISMFSPLMSKLLLRQDKNILKYQGEIISKDGENYVSTIADTANIWIRNYNQKSQKGLKENSKSKNINFKL